VRAHAPALLLFCMTFAGESSANMYSMGTRMFGQVSRDGSATCDVWRVACGVWRVACGVWRVACGVWRVACGVWRVACGVWRVACGV
jgi:hypothetical protein